MPDYNPRHRGQKECWQPLSTKGYMIAMTITGIAALIAVIMLQPLT